MGMITNQNYPLGTGQFSFVRQIEIRFKQKPHIRHGRTSVRVAIRVSGTIKRLLRRDDDKPLTHSELAPSSF
jgi:hypothetical protein